MTPEQIIGREIRKQRPNVERITVRLDDDTETWVVTLDGKMYIMEIGSDDDRFAFTSEDDDCIVFDYPSDWPSL